jgi:alpha-L-fucosidase
MINIALKGDGTIPDNQTKMLSDFGAFVKINQEGIYNTRPWKIFGEGPLEIVTKRAGENLKKYSAQDIRFTYKSDNLYAFVLAAPSQDILITTLKTEGVLEKEIKSIELLGSSEKIIWRRSNDGLLINQPEALPNKHGLVFKITLK